MHDLIMCVLPDLFRSSLSAYSERLGLTPETLSEAQRAREVGGAHGHMGPHTMLALSTECLEGEGH